MCECLHRARASKISLKNVASTPTFSLSIGDVLLTNERDRPYWKAKLVSTRIIRSLFARARVELKS